MIVPIPDDGRVTRVLVHTETVMQLGLGNVLVVMLVALGLVCIAAFRREH